MRDEVLNKIVQSTSGRMNLLNANIEDGEILEILQEINQRYPSISTIDLDSNKLGDEGAMILSEHLGEFENLKELSIQFNNIGKQGAVKLFGLMNVFPELDILFHGNKITNFAEMEDIKNEAVSHPNRP